MNGDQSMKEVYCAKTTHNIIITNYDDFLTSDTQQVRKNYYMNHFCHLPQLCV